MCMLDELRRPSGRDRGLLCCLAFRRLSSRADIAIALFRGEVKNMF
uniref:Uncharacterized protein n=1 Tax=Setaria viridis TaxID=4556 RepID=A0A4U6VUD3_SETVI|nr:hypothetical protein SEVIR_2G202650v2 [Setaria viridis]